MQFIVKNVYFIGSNTNNIVHIKYINFGIIFFRYASNWELVYNFCVCYSNIFILYMCKSETIRNWLIDYLTFYVGYWKSGSNWSIYHLFSESTYTALTYSTALCYNSMIHTYHTNFHKIHKNSCPHFCDKQPMGMCILVYNVWRYLNYYMWIIQ